MAGVEVDEKRREKWELCQGISNWICTWISYTISERIFLLSTNYSQFHLESFFPFRFPFSRACFLLHLNVHWYWHLLIFLTRNRSGFQAGGRERGTPCALSISLSLSLPHTPCLLTFFCSTAASRDLWLRTSRLPLQPKKHRMQLQLPLQLPLLAQVSSGQTMQMFDWHISAMLAPRVPCAICHMPSALCLVPRVYLGDRPDRLVRSFLGLCA